jgi:hypothetical protein
MWGMDRFRIAGLLKLLRAGIRGEKRGWAIETLKRKAAILAHGARKRGKEQEALCYEALLAEFCEEKFKCRTSGFAATREKKDSIKRP